MAKTTKPHKKEGTKKKTNKTKQKHKTTKKQTIKTKNQKRKAPTWTRPFLRFLIEGTLPQDVSEARRISRRSMAFTVINNQVYKRSITQILQKCIDEEDGKALLLEIHEGTCGHH